MITAIALFQIQQYVTDKQLLKGQVQQMKLDSLIHLAYSDVKGKLAQDGELEQNLTFSYEGGEVTLAFRAEYDYLQQFTMIARLHSGEMRRAWIYIHYHELRIERYEEGSMGGI